VSVEYVGELVTVPVFPVPELSATDVPLPSSNLHHPFKLLLLS